MAQHCNDDDILRDSNDFGQDRTGHSLAGWHWTTGGRHSLSSFFFFFFQQHDNLGDNVDMQPEQFVGEWWKQANLQLLSRFFSGRL